MACHKYQLIIAVNDPKEDQALIEDWLKRNEDIISDNEGCGCCVDIFEFECEEELVRDLPKLYLTIKD